MSDHYLQAFDTYKYIKELKGGGFYESQAEVIVKSLLESREYNISKLATWEQISLMELTVNNKIDRLERALKNSEGKLDSKILQVEQNLKAEITGSQLNMLKWMIPFSSPSSA
ncbi:CCDC90 family protein [Candidatus Jidaibacter acanthamoebae]|nr:DUF1640 domain-containing protein [Candidatus Jidaibacter acanthamoeba]